MSLNLPGILKLTLKWLAGLFAVLLVTALLLLWRLSASPIQLNQLVPRIEQAASGLPGGLSVRLTGIGLFWNRAERQVDFKATDVELLDPSGASLVSVPEVEISLSVFALVHGVFALSSIELSDVDVHLVRGEDGSFQIFKNNGSGEPSDSQDRGRTRMASLQNLFKLLPSEPDPARPLSYLKKLKLRGSVQIEDRKSGFSWSARDVDSEFTGHKGKVRGHLGVTFGAPDALRGIHTDVTLSLENDALTAKMDFTGVKPAGLTALDQRLSVLAGLDVSLAGSLDVALTLPDTIHRLDATLKASPGRFNLDEYYPRAVSIQGFDLALSADPAAGSVQVSGLDLELGEPAEPLKLRLKGSAQKTGEALAVSLETRLQALEVRDFDSYWPRGVAEGARNWLVKNLQAGVVDTASMDLAMQVPVGAGAGFRLDKLKGNLDFRDLTVGFFGELPAATGVTGGGVFDAQGFDLDVRKGQVNGVGIESGKVLISGLDEHGAAISINTRLAGPVASVFATLESPPLNLGAHSMVGRISQRLEGAMNADFSIGLPLKSGLRAEDVDFRAKGRISNGRYRKLYRGLDLHDADVDFDLDNSRVEFVGPLAFAGVPLAVDWTSHLEGPARGGANFTVDAPKITSTLIEHLGFKASDFMRGRFGLKTKGELAPGGRLTASIETDFNEASLTVPVIRWTKVAGEDGSVTLDLVTEDKRLQGRNIRIELGDVSTGGQVEFDLAGPVLSASVEHLTLPVARLDGLKLQRNEDRRLSISVQGGEASLESLLSRKSPVAKTREKPHAEKQPAASKQADGNGPSIEIGPSVLDKLFIDKDTWFEQIQFSARRDDKGWQSVEVTGHDPSASGAPVVAEGELVLGDLAPGQFSFSYGPAANGRYPVHLEVANFGSMLSAIARKEVMNGGYLVLDGDSEGPFLTMPLQTTFEMDGFTVKDAPGIVNVLNMASLTQILSTLTQTGLAFRRARGDLQLDGTRLSSRQTKMTGGSLGVFTGGRLDFKDMSVEAGGTIVPLHKINTLVGKVPLLGQVVAGKDGQGIMAVDYRLTGNLSDPEVSVSRTPLTQGVLNILDEDGEDGDTARR